MFFGTTCSTEILNSVMAPFLFVLPGFLCEFGMVPGVYILLSSQEHEVHCSSQGHRWTYSEAHS